MTEPDASADYGFSSNIAVRFAETDAQGVAHNAAYVVWLEVARVDYLARFDGGYQGMRVLLALLIVIILLSWTFAIAAAFAPDVERLPGHDIRVRRDACLQCHAQQIGAAPPMNHPSAPTCGFCHMQGLPPTND